MSEIGRVLRSRPRWIVVADPSPYDFDADVWQTLHTALRSYRVVTSYTEEDYGRPLPSGDGFEPITVRLYHAADGYVTVSADE